MVDGASGNGGLPAGAAGLRFSGFLGVGVDGGLGRQRDGGDAGESGDEVIDWKEAPAVKARLAGGFCIRAQVQGPCAYANICEHCPNFRTDTGYLPVLAAQRADTETLARDAEARGWTSEPERHRRLIARLDAHISQAQTG